MFEGPKKRDVLQLQGGATIREYGNLHGVLALEL